MEFFGVLKTPTLPSETRKTFGPHRVQDEHTHPLPFDTLFLVSKFATKGNLDQYLGSVLTGVAEKDWAIVLEMMLDILHELRSYHERNLIHR